MFEKRLVFCHPGGNLIKRRIVQAHLRLTSQDKGVGPTHIEVKMQAHLWILLDLCQSVAILLCCAVDEKGGMRLIPQKCVREGVRCPGCINSGEPEKQFLAQAAKDLLSSRSRGIGRLKRCLAMMREASAVGCGGIRRVRRHRVFLSCVSL